MKVKSIAECSPWSILQYFCPALSDKSVLKTNFGVLFEWPLKTGFTVLSRFSVILNVFTSFTTGPHSAVGNVSGYRCVSDCRSRGREFDPGPVPYFRGD